MRVSAHHCRRQHHLPAGQTSLKKARFRVLFSGAGGGGRTRTVLPPLDFESSTSANSITPASVRS